jgi:hypothetical protein
MSDIVKWLRIAPPDESRHVLFREARGALWIKLKEAADEIEKLRTALRDIARQKKTDELDTEYDVEVADFEGGYDSIIDIARAALGETQ